MKEYNKYLIIGIVIIIVSLLFYYFSNIKEETFTYEEEQIITAQLLAANGGFIPQTAIGGSGNPDDISQYKYMNSKGINVNDMPLNAQRLTNPLCFNDVLHSHPYTSSNKKGGAHSKGNHGANLNHDKFEKEETPALKQLIKANDQLIDANEELLRLSGKGNYVKQKKEHNKRHTHLSKNGSTKEDDKKEEKKWQSSPTHIRIDDLEDGKKSITIDKGSTGNTNISNANNSGTNNSGTNNRWSSTPTYSSAYERQNVGSAYTKCLTTPYGKLNPEYCNNMYGTKYPEESTSSNSGSSNRSSSNDDGTGLSWFNDAKNRGSNSTIIDPNNTISVNSGGYSYNLPMYDNIEQNGIDNLGLSSYGAKQVLHRTSQPTSSSFFNKQNGYDANQYDSKVGSSFTDINTGKSMIICSTDTDCASGTKCSQQNGWGVKTCS